MKTPYSVGLAVSVFISVVMVLLVPALEASEEAALIAPDFTLADCLSGDTLRLYDFLDHPALLFFFDAGSVPDLAACQYVKEWYRRYAGDGLKIIGIHCPRFEPMKRVNSARSAVGRAIIGFPVGMDMDRNVYEAYSVSDLPTYVLLRPGAEVYFRTSEKLAYQEIEQAIQELLKEIKPDIIHPFVLKPLRPADDPEAELRLPTPMVVLGYSSGLIDGCDSTRFDEFADYTDSGELEKDKVYLRGRWKVERDFITHSQETPDETDHVRLIYSGKDVWILPFFEGGGLSRVYVKQDRTYLSRETMGKAIRFDDRGRSFIDMHYAVPLHIVSNPEYGTHQIELTPTAGNISLVYLYFEGDVAEGSD
jgi:peroxiredoxin